MFRLALVLLLMAGAALPAAAQNVSVPLNTQKPAVGEGDDSSDIDPTTGFRLPPGARQNPPPTVNWDPPPDPDPGYAFMRGLGAFEGELSQSVRQACGLRNIRIVVDRLSFQGHIPAQRNLRSYAGAIVTSMRNICGDNRTRSVIDDLMGQLTIVNEPGRSRVAVTGSGYTARLVYDFAALKPIEARLLTPEILRAITRLVAEYDQRRTRYQPRSSEDDKDEP